MAEVIDIELGLAAGLSSAPVAVSGFENDYVYGEFGGVSLVSVRAGRLDDGVPAMVARTARAARLKVAPGSSTQRGPMRVEARIYEGMPVRLMGRAYWCDGSLVDARDVLMAEVFVLDVTSQPPQLLTRLAPPVRSVVATELVQDDFDWGADSIGFQVDALVPADFFEGGRLYVVELLLTRKSVDRERLPMVATIQVDSLLSMTPPHGRRASTS